MHMRRTRSIIERKSDLVMVLVWKNLKFTTEKIVYCIMTVNENVDHCNVDKD